MESYCKIFIDAMIKYDEFFDIIFTYLGGSRQGVSTILTPWCSISCKYNSYYNKHSYLSNRSDFIYWMYYLDMECIDGIPLSEYISKIKEMLFFLRNTFSGAVPECDFENMLV